MRFRIELLANEELRLPGLVYTCFRERSEKEISEEKGLI